MRALGSFEGLHHALAYPKCYSLSRKDLLSRTSFISKPFGPQSEC